MGIKVKVDQARPVIPEGNTPVDMVTEGKDTLDKVKASSNYGSAPGVQAAATAFETAMGVLQTNNAAKAKARADLETAEANEPVFVRRLNAQRRSLNSAIEVFADGSKDLANSFGAPLAGSETSPEAITPENLRGMHSKTHDRAGVRWDPVPGAHGYILQHATNQNDPTTFSPEISVNGARFWLAGQTRGATVYFRVLACDDRLPNGRTTYTAWLGVLVT